MIPTGIFINWGSMRPIFDVGILVNSAIYLGACFVAGLYTGNAWAWRASIAALGLTYLSYNFQVLDEKIGRNSSPVTLAAVWGSVFFGLVAGILLLWR